MVHRISTGRLWPTRPTVNGMRHFCRVVRISAWSRQNKDSFLDLKRT
jgi:hypothetical protein